MSRLHLELHSAGGQAVIAESVVAQVVDQPVHILGERGQVLEGREQLQSRPPDTRPPTSPSHRFPSGCSGALRTLYQTASCPHSCPTCQQKHGGRTRMTVDTALVPITSQALSPSSSEMNSFNPHSQPATQIVSTTTGRKKKVKHRQVRKPAPGDPVRKGRGPDCSHCRGSPSPWPARPLCRAFSSQGSRQALPIKSHTPEVAYTPPDT